MECGVNAIFRWKLKPVSDRVDLLRDGPMNLVLSLRHGRRRRMSLVDSQTFCPG